MLEPRTVLLNCCSTVFPCRPSSDFLRSICCAAVTRLLLCSLTFPGLDVGLYGVANSRSGWVSFFWGGGSLDPPFHSCPSAARPSRCPVSGRVGAASIRGHRGCALVKWLGGLSGRCFMMWKRLGDGDGRIDASLGDTPRGSRSVRSPSPRRRAPRVNEDRLLSAEERDRDSVAQILERSQHILNSILSTEEAQAFLDGVGLGVEYMNNFAQLLETRGQPVVALVAMGFAIASAIGVFTSCIVLHTSNTVFHLSIRTLQVIFSSWYKTKLLLISSMLCILVVVGNVLNFSTQFYMGIGCGVLLGVFLI